MPSKNERAKQQAEMYERFKRKIKKKDRRNKLGRYTPPKPERLTGRR